MAPRKTSIYADNDLNRELKRINFIEFLEQLHGRKWGSRRPFIEERKLNHQKVYRQLNKTDPLEDEMLKEMAAFMKDHK